MSNEAVQGEEPTTFRLRAVVQGRVQGVGYRFWTHHTANRLSISGGVVRNLPEGHVEVIAESNNRRALEVLLHELHVGPTPAQVIAVESYWDEGVEAEYTSFRVADGSD